MDAKEFTPIWKKFCTYYNVSHDNQVQFGLYFDEYAYLPAKAVDYIFTQTMKQVKAFRALPTISEISPHKYAAFAKRDKLVKDDTGEPELPGVVRQSNATFLKLIIETQTAKKEKGLQHVIENHAEYWAKFYMARVRIEIETDCPEYWTLSQQRFEETVKTVGGDFYQTVINFMVTMRADYDPVMEAEQQLPAF